MPANLHLEHFLSFFALLQGINPKIHYTMQPLTGSNKLYHITQDGIVIAKTDQLRAFDRHILEVTIMI